MMITDERLEAAMQAYVNAKLYNQGSPKDWVRAALEAAIAAAPEPRKPFAWYWFDKLGCLFITGDDRKPDVPADALPLYTAPVIPAGWALVPQSAIDWLMGEGPGMDGLHFSEFPDDHPPRGAFWWREHFRAMLARPTPPGTKGCDVRNAEVPANEIVDFIYKHGDLTYSAAQAVVQLLTGNRFRFVRNPEGRG